ncbi:hypothetical protein EDD99_4490 [Streptomyces sp. 846.5]|nr:hypothetical protein EDD99_4490 [Streptomyces sp. 846.5]
MRAMWLDDDRYGLRGNTNALPMLLGRDPHPSSRQSLRPPREAGPDPLVRTR